MDIKGLADRISSTLNAKRQRTILIIIILLLLTGMGIFVNRFMVMKNNLAISEQNRKALADSVRYEKNKNGDEVAAKNILIADKNNKIENLNKKLAEAVKDNDGKIREVIRTVTVIKTDTVYVNNDLVDYGSDSAKNKTYGLSWKYDTTYNETNSTNLAGISKFKLDTLGKVTPLNTIITLNKIKFDMTTGLRENGDNVEIFVTSKHPLLKTIELDGAIINPKKHPALTKFTKPKRWGFGPYVGVGAGIGVYPKAEFQVGFHVGFSIHYSLIQF